MIGNYISRLYKARERFLLSELSKLNLDINNTEFSILIYLFFNKRMSHTELQKQVMINKSNITRMVKLLLNKGFIQKEADLNDSRYSFVSLTSNAKKLVSENLLPIVNRFNNHFSKSDEKFLENLLTKIEEGVDNESFNN